MTLRSCLSQSEYKATYILQFLSVFPRIRQLDLLYFLSIYLYLCLISPDRINCHVRPARAELPSLVVVIERQDVEIKNPNEAI